MSEQVVKSTRYHQSVDDFIASNSGIDPSWKNVISPMVTESEDELFYFIVGAFFS